MKIAETIEMQRQVIADATSTGARISAQKALVALLIAGGRKTEAVDANSLLVNDIDSTSGAKSKALLAPLELQKELLTELKRKKEARAVKKRIKKLKKALR